jgi:hypothetical protein
MRRVVQNALMIHLRALLLAGLSCLFTTHLALAETNTPPPTKVFIHGNGAPDFLGFTNVYLLRRAEKTARLDFHLGADHDDEGELLYFYWYEGDNVVSNLPRYTNDYAHGLHTLHVAVSDNRDVNDLHVPLEIISPLDAIRRLRADLELTGRRENIDSLRPLLYGAEKAIRRREWRVAQRRLQRFDERLSVYLDVNTEKGAALIARWEVAARRLGQSVQVIRKGDAAPGGLFPGTN